MSAIERWALWLTSGATAGSGLLFAWMKYLLDPLDAWSVINHPWQPAVLRLHIVAAPLLVLTIGFVAARHISHHMRANAPRGRWTGLVVVGSVLPMIVSGSAVQVVADARAAQWMGVAHLACGATYAVGLVLHRIAAGFIVGVAAAARQGADGS